MSRLRIAAAILFASIIPLAAQTHFEISAGLGFLWPAWQGTYLHAYEPGFLYGMTGTGSGRQTLTFAAQPSSGAVFGAAFFITSRFALQVLFDDFSSDVTGTTTTHDTTVTYTSRQPPDDMPRTYTVSSSDNPAETGGQLTDRIISLNGLVRIPLGAGFSLDLSAGGSWFHAGGNLGYPEYTEFWMGGNSVLFSQTYSLQMIFDPLDRIGWNAGAAFSWAFGRNAGLWAEARYFGCAKTTPQVTFRDTGAIPPMRAFDPASDVIPVGDLALDPSGFRIGAGFKFIF
ncbi:MAG: hypothetical protein ABSA30_08125 [Candidatus Aminicenantales bacterium]|jgi:hypothetical protein